MKKKIAITMGDPAGIGPEVIVKALNSIKIDNHEFTLIGNKEIFLKTASEMGQQINENIEILDIPCDVSQIKYGKSNIENGRFSFLALELACKLALSKQIKAIVTAPLSKKAINLAGYNYSGQTEILQKYLGSENNIESRAEMLFVAKDFRILLLTRHISLSQVPQVLTIDKIIESVRVLNSSLINDFKIKSPKMAICGVNPHAGEDGLLGKEEKDIIIPALIKLREDFGIIIDKPFPADTIWRKAAKPYMTNQQQPFDAYIACYHDQGLIPIKLLAMNSTVNTTINLPVIRTSPSHGTAYDIAGKNIANPESMIEAINLAWELSN